MSPAFTTVLNGCDTKAALRRRRAAICTADTREDEEPKEGLWTYVFGKEGEFDRDLNRLGTTRRRFG